MLSRLLCLPTYYNIALTKIYASEKQGGTFSTTTTNKEDMVSTHLLSGEADRASSTKLNNSNDTKEY
jgi:hypothetical protein